MKKNKILLIIPAYNEEGNILKTVEKIKNYKIKYDYIVINDGSTDLTPKILDENNINHIDLIHNLGIGGAVQTGYKYAYENDYDIAVQYDGDGQHDIKYVESIIKPIIEEKADMVIGSRFVDKNSSDFKSTGARRIGIKLISWIIKFKTNKKVYDTTSGFRAVNKNIINLFKKNYPVEYPEPISTVFVLKNGFAVDEVPVSMNERESGVSSIRAWKNAYYMINVFMSILFIGKKAK